MSRIPSTTKTTCGNTTCPGSSTSSAQRSRMPLPLASSTRMESSRMPVPLASSTRMESSRMPVPLASSTRIARPAPGAAEQLSRMPRPTGSGTRIKAVSARDASKGTGRQLIAAGPSDEKIEGPSLLQKRVFRQALSKSAQEPGKKVRSVGSALTPIKPAQAMTKRGKECLIQQMTMETTVQRTPKAEFIGKTMRGVDVAPSGAARQLEMTSAQIDPTHGTESAGVNETVSVTNSLSVTTGGRQLKKQFKKKTLISEKLAKQPNLNPHHINRLVKEETEDVENTLKMVPPDLVSTSVEKYPIKKKLQALRLNAEPVSILTESIIYPAPTADEVDAEAPPEVVASVLDAVEKGATPDLAPNQIFNSLFPTVQEPRINVSSVAPGPLEDIVVPTSSIGHTSTVVEEVLTQEMEDFIAAEVQNKVELPKDDICTENNIEAAKRTPKGGGKAPMFLEEEPPPWEDQTIRRVSGLIGGDPIEEMNASDVSGLESPADISQELSKGVDYFIDADIPYETRIQIRGSKIPKWFPGYMSAFPHLPELVKISRTPSEVLHAAWKAVQPKIFPEDALLIT